MSDLKTGLDSSAVCRDACWLANSTLFPLAKVAFSISSFLLRISEHENSIHNRELLLSYRENGQSVKTEKAL